MKQAPRKPTFFRQGLLIVLPVVLLAGFGLYFLRQDKRLAEDAARERAQTLADNLAAHFSKDFYQRLTDIYLDVIIDGFNQRGKPHNPRTDTVSMIDSRLRMETVAPAHGEIIRGWPESPFGEIWCASGITLDASGNLIGVGLALDAKGDVRFQSTVRAPRYADKFTPLPDSALPEAQRALWREAQLKEYSPGQSGRAVELYNQFIATSPPPDFEEAARYASAVLLAKAGERDAAGKIFQQIEHTKKSVTMNAIITPLALLAQWQDLRLEAEKLKSSGKHDTDDFWARVLQLTTNAVITPTVLTGPLLEQTRALTNNSTMKEPQSVWAWRCAWQTDENTREFYQDNRRALLSQSNREQPFWVSWHGQEWFVFATPVLNESGQSHVARTNGYNLSVYPEAIVHAAVYEALAGRSDWVPEYATVSLSLSGRQVRGPTTSFARLAQADGNWDMNEKAVGGFTLCVTLENPTLLYARENTRTIWMAALIAATALAALYGFLVARRAFYRQLRLNEMKSDFVSSVSHELRAPIASVRLMAEGLERGSVQSAEKQREYFRFIVQECRRLSSLIENVLDFSRIEQGRKEYELESADILAMTRQTVNLMETYAEERQLHLDLQTRGAPVPVDLDAKAMQQALVNLIDNALKHSPKGSTVTVGLDFPDATKSGRIELWVEDCGPGIPKVEHEKIFERFYRIGSEMRRETEGAGIGLSIVKHIVEAHGGVVKVRSAPGEGSRFTIELPQMS